VRFTRKPSAPGDLASATSSAATKLVAAYEAGIFRVNHITKL
jgi:hypothetical protein